MKPYKLLKKKIERDKQRKLEKRKKQNAEYDNIKKVITTKHYIDALNKCNLGVSYKRSVQKYNSLGIININNTINIVESGKIPNVGNVHKVTIRERGKERIITPIHIEDRITQRVLCDYALVPVFSKLLIYDNGASSKGKGVDFARKRLVEHIEEAKREYGSNFYALVFDFKSFFDSIPHIECYNILNENFKDKNIRDLVIGIIESYQLSDILKEKNESIKKEQLQKLYNHENVGICLGSQISQIMALAVPNKFDHYIKDQLSLRHYIRYMDDGVILHNDKDFLKKIKLELESIANKYGLNFNKTKTKVVKMSKGFTFMKVKYVVTKSGKTIKTLSRSGITRMRRKLRKFKVKVDAGEMNLDDVYASIQSWLAHSSIAKSYHTRKRMLNLYDDLFGGYKLTKKYFKSKNNQRSHQ